MNTRQPCSFGWISHYASEEKADRNPVGSIKEKKNLQYSGLENGIKSYLVKSAGTDKCLTTEATQIAASQGTVPRGPTAEFSAWWQCRQGEISLNTQALDRKDGSLHLYTKHMQGSQQTPEIKDVV